MMRQLSGEPLSGAGYLDVDPAQTPHGSIALQFADALVAGKFELAHTLLSPPLRAAHSPPALAATFREMVAYFHSDPWNVSVVSTMSDWPGKLPHDVGWAHAGIGSDSENEGVTVIVADYGGQLLIRDIEWGRP